MAGRRSSALVLLACVTLAACGGGGGGGGGPGGGGGNGVLLASVTTGTFLGVDPLSGEGTRISAVGLTGFRSVQGVTFDEATGTLYGHLFTTPGSADGSLSYALGVVPPPCRINVSGDAALTRTTLDGTYRGANDCVEDAIRVGRVTLARP